MPLTIPSRILSITFAILLLGTICVKSSVNALSQPFVGRAFSRNLRAPMAFQHKDSSMMTARGFGKRSFYDYSDGDAWESSLLNQLLGNQQAQMRISEVDTKRSPHIMEIREPRLRFRLADDGNLRIGRGFGKRSIESDNADDVNEDDIDGQKEEYKTPWSSPSIREWNEAEKILKSVLKQVQETEKEQN
uniref:CSON014570 protein n=1 Tax=Culicoides sonorensis TaxID=179676 RepID=A0A336MNB5_CULSO